MLCFHAKKGGCMKKLVCAFVAMVLLISSVFAAQRVNGYTTRNGTYVAPHYRSTSDGNRYNNYSTRGNYNPYTGAKGYTNPYKPRTYTYKQKRYY